MTKPPDAISGFQIAFLVFAVVVFSIPLAKYTGPWTPEAADALTRAFIFGTAAAVLLAIPRVRRACKELLATPIRLTHAAEVAAVTGLHLLTPFALCGVIALEAWIQGGPDALASRMSRLAADSLPGAEAYSVVGLVIRIPVGCLVAPIIEELLFRGFMYRAWARQFGWFVAMVLSALAFSLYHSFFTAAFTGAIIYTCLYRRTGSLRAPILVHCIYNTAVLYPLLGQLIYRPVGGDPSDLLAWWLQLSCLAVTLVLVPSYVWLARKPGASG